MFIWINYLNLFRMNTVFMINWDFGSLPVTSQLPFPALWVGKSQWGSSLTIGSALAWLSSIKMKYLLMLFYHDIEHTNTDKRQNVIFSVP